MSAPRRPAPPTGAAFYHGGPPGLASVGPRQETDARATAPFGDYRRFLAPPYRVYVTTELRMARYYAAAWAFVEDLPAGHVYAVRPCGDVDVDIATPGSWTCDTAEVTAVREAVSGAQLPALAAWRQQWIARQPPRLASERERLAFCARAVERAVRHGYDRAQVLAVLDAAAEANARLP